jgi:hypothetical protein
VKQTSTLPCQQPADSPADGNEVNDIFKYGIIYLFETELSEGQVHKFSHVTIPDYTVSHKLTLYSSLVSLREHQMSHGAVRCTNNSNGREGSVGFRGPGCLAENLYVAPTGNQTTIPQSSNP